MFLVFYLLACEAPPGEPPPILITMENRSGSMLTSFGVSECGADTLYDWADQNIRDGEDVTAELWLARCYQYAVTEHRSQRTAVGSTERLLLWGDEWTWTVTGDDLK